MEYISAYCGNCNRYTLFQAVDGNLYSCAQCGIIAPKSQLEEKVKEKPLEIQRFEDEGGLASV